MIIEIRSLIFVKALTSFKDMMLIIGSHMSDG